MQVNRLKDAMSNIYPQLEVNVKKKKKRKFFTQLSDSTLSAVILSNLPPVPFSYLPGLSDAEA